MTLFKLIKERDDLLAKVSALQATIESKDDMIRQIKE